MTTRNQADSWFRSRIGNILEEFDEQMDQARRAFDKNIVDARSRIVKEINAAMEHYETGLEADGAVEYRQYVKGQAVITLLDGKPYDVSDEPLALPIDLEEWTKPSANRAILTFHAAGGAVSLPKPIGSYYVSFWPDGPLRINDNEDERQWTIYNVERLYFDDREFIWADDILTAVQ